MKVIVYSSNSCGFCIKQKDFLSKNGINYEERDITNNTEHFKEFQALGARGVPHTVIKDGEKLVATVTGFDEAELSKILL